MLDFEIDKLRAQDISKNVDQSNYLKLIQDILSQSLMGLQHINFGSYPFDSRIDNLLIRRNLFYNTVDNHVIDQRMNNDRINVAVIIPDHQRIGGMNFSRGELIKIYGEELRNVASTHLGHLYRATSKISGIKRKIKTTQAGTHITLKPGESTIHYGIIDDVFLSIDYIDYMGKAWARIFSKAYESDAFFNSPTLIISI